MNKEKNFRLLNFPVLVPEIITLLGFSFQFNFGKPDFTPEIAIPIENLTS